LNFDFLGAGDDENALVDNEEAQAEEVLIVLIEVVLTNLQVGNTLTNLQANF